MSRHRSTVLGDPALARAILALAIERPDLGHARAAEVLAGRGIPAPASLVSSVWQTHGLANRTLRCRAVQAEAARTGRPLTGPQCAAIELDRRRGEEHGHSAPRPGHTLAHAVFAVGRLADGTRVLQQTVVDAHTRTAFCRLRLGGGQAAGAAAAAGVRFLRDEVIPFFAARGLPPRRVLTSRERLFCSGGARGAYGAFLSRNGIEHVTTSTTNPRANVVCDRFQETALREFYRPRTAPWTYAAVASVQTALGVWLSAYNNTLPLTLRRRFGEVPMRRLSAFLAGEGGSVPAHGGN